MLRSLTVDDLALYVVLWMAAGAATFLFELVYKIFVCRVPEEITRQQYDAKMLSLFLCWPLYWLYFLLDIVSPER
jgi:hypothetical protein